MHQFFQHPGLLAATMLTLAAVAILAFAGALSRRQPLVLGIAFAGVALAALAGMRPFGESSLAILGTAALTALGLVLLPTVELERDEQHVESASLLLLGAAGGIVLATEKNLLSLVLGLETLTLSVAVLTGLGRGPRPLEAAFKFFVLAGVSLATAIYGIGLYAYATGTFQLGAPVPAEESLALLYKTGLVMVTLGFAFELAVVPMHFGALGAYMSAPVGVVAFAMTASKLGTGLALLRLTTGPAGALIGPVLIGVGVVSILWATFAALHQRDLRGMLAYSAIAHAGFVALALGCGEEGRRAAIYYLAVYAASAGLVMAALAGRAGALPFAEVRSRPLGPLRTFALVLGLLSLAGVPPSPGFWAKLGVLLPAWQLAGPTLTCLAALGGVFGALYYLRPVPDLLANLRSGTREQGFGVRLAIVGAGAVVLALMVAPRIANRLAVWVG